MENFDQDAVDAAVAVMQPQIDAAIQRIEALERGLTPVLHPKTVTESYEVGPDIFYDRRV